ncbi:MAG: efflux RND transporter periplasmic adaptor subunit [Gammaproteobacteria bacterium]|nr:efflux RND transporter periplasmic adaptor subunit [Gammaproteobacteria bacterium]
MSQPPRRLLARLLVIAAILGIAVLIAVVLVKGKPPPEKKETPKVTMLIEAVPLERTTVTFSVESQGNVRPRTETVLSAEVAGSIISVSDSFVAGGVFRKGDVLLRIDPSNYTVAVEQARALLEQRQIEYDGAIKLKQSGYQADASVASAAAALASAKAGLTRAQRDLQRTYIKLPYDGMVKSKDVDVGQFVNAGSRLGVTFATDYAEVRLPLTDQDLAFIDLPDSGNGSGPRVTLEATRKGVLRTWEAVITRTEGVVDENTRVTYAVARLDDPYGFNNGEPGNDAAVPLPVGSFVKARIEGVTMPDVIRVPRPVLRGRNEMLFVEDDNTLRLRNVVVLRTDQNYAYIMSGTEPGERVVLTAIESPVNGMKVRVSGDEPEVSSAETANDEVESEGAGG